MHVGLHTTDKRTLLVSQHFEYTLLLMIADYRNENKVPNKSKYEIAAKHFDFFFASCVQSNKCSIMCTTFIGERLEKLAV